MLSDKKGDPQARAELLGQLLNAASEPAYMLVHGQDRDAVHLVLLAPGEGDLKEWSTAWKRQVPTVKVGSRPFVALPLKKGAQPGDLPEGIYDAAAQRWTGTIAVRRFR